jgi:hypothetical protein
MMGFLSRIKSRLEERLLDQEIGLVLSLRLPARYDFSRDAALDMLVQEADFGLVK